mgnify:CR=1 FL=1
MTTMNKYLIKKFREYSILEESAESYSGLQGKLVERLLSISGNDVKLGRDKESEIKRMLEGKEFKSKVVYVEGEPNRCHANVAKRAKGTKGFNIASGYALSDDGVWYSHSWGFNSHKKCVFETTKNKYSKYYGYELNKAETIDFCSEN